MVCADVSYITCPFPDVSPEYSTSRYLRDDCRHTTGASIREILRMCWPRVRQRRRVISTDGNDTPHDINNYNIILGQLPERKQLVS